MNHAQVRSQLGDYMEGDLSDAAHTAIDQHLDACPTCRGELRELRSVVGLVRGLPDPQPRLDLAGAVMARIEAGEGAPPMRLIPGGLRRLAEPRFMTALAAGFAGLLAWSMLPALSSLDGGPSPAPEIERGAIRVATLPALPSTAGGRSEPLRRPRLRGRAPAAPVLAGFELPRRGAAFRGGVAPAIDVLEVDVEVDEMDRHLQRLWADPTLVLNRMGERPRGDLFARLAQRAARQGQAAALASRLISSPHPMANGLASRMLAASLAEDVRLRQPDANEALR